jgi:hypothetical protein
MSSNPINLIVRFLLEVITLVVVSYWGFYTYNGFIAYLIGIGTPIAMATIWGVFAVANDPSRSGKTVVNTPGIVRLLIELVYFGIATYAFYATGYILYGYIFTTIVIIHYFFSYDRIKWLLKQA